MNLIRLPYNAAWILPIALTFLGALDYRTGFYLFTVITFIRLTANLYRNNALTLEQAERFPFQA